MFRTGLSLMFMIVRYSYEVIPVCPPLRMPYIRSDSLVYIKFLLKMYDKMSSYFCYVRSFNIICNLHETKIEI